MSYDVLNRILENDEPPEKKEDTPDPNPNLRLVQCCVNCKFYWYEWHKPKRGRCKLISTTEKPMLRNPDKEKLPLPEWPKRHATMCCDNHKYSSYGHSFVKVSKWSGINFNADGSKSDE